LDPNFAETVENKYGIQLLGHYIDTEDHTTGGFNPEVDFSLTGGGFVVTDVTAVSQPPGPGVDWLQMSVTSGQLAETVLLVGGLQPIDADVSIPRSVMGTRN
jgi:hypothetical protein